MPFVLCFLSDLPLLPPCRDSHLTASHHEPHLEFPAASLPNAVHFFALPLSQSQTARGKQHFVELGGDLRPVMFHRPSWLPQPYLTVLHSDLLSASHKLPFLAHEPREDWAYLPPILYSTPSLNHILPNPSLFQLLCLRANLCFCYVMVILESRHSTVSELR